MFLWIGDLGVLCLQEWDAREVPRLVSGAAAISSGRATSSSSSRFASSTSTTYQSESAQAASDFVG